ncbi:hypothetical protein QBC43DRAFT_372563 [Cladorrhinum sp. PSN259]|nr:hypothetical protein QBC43DRAFT_372563 [Cladorrhinum sp. PSN259]
MSSQQSAVIISGFICSGQADLLKQGTHGGYQVINLESTSFQTNPTTKAQRTPADFAKAYIAKIAEYSNKKVILMVSTHPEIRDEMCKRGLKYTLVYPGLACKAEWLGRIEKQAGKGKLYKTFNDDWKTFVEGLGKGTPTEVQKGAKRVVLGAGGSLTKAIDGIIKNA